MSSKREQVLAALFGRLQGVPDATVRRNEALPVSVPAGGLIIMRDGDAGEPDVTLNPRTEYRIHRVEVEAYVAPPGGGAEGELDALLSWVGARLRSDLTLGGLVEVMTWTMPEISPVTIDGAVPVLAARLDVLLEYLVDHSLS